MAIQRNSFSLNKVVDPKIDENNIWEDDVLDRETCADRFTAILEGSHGPLVVSVSSPFGTGKTFFAERWKKSLRHHGKAAVSFNAWESDFAEDPLIAFVGQLHEELNSLGLTKSSTKRLQERLLSFAKVGLGIGLRVGMRAAFGAAIHHAVGEDVESEAEAALNKGAEEVEKYVLGRIENFANEKAVRQTFKEQLSVWRLELEKARKRTNSFKGVDDHKIYIFVDELDRCRPDYAVTLLEAIKHLFEVEGFVFVLFVDEDQLQRQTTQVYGEKLDGEPFLRKFIDYRLSLPLPSYEEFARFLVGNSQFKDVLVSPNFVGRSEIEISRNFAFFSEKFSLSLRTQWRVFRTLELIAALYDSRHLTPAIFLSCLREHDIAGWKEFSRTLSAPEAAFEQVDYIQFKEVFNEGDGNYDDPAILEVYLYLRIFVDSEMITPKNIDQVTQRAHSFFEGIFETTPSEAFRNGKTKELRDQIELVEKLQAR